MILRRGAGRRLILLLCSAQLLNTANFSSMNIALPYVALDLRLADATLPWVISAYAIMFAGFLLVAGRLADLVGRRRMLVTGFGLSAAAALAGALAPLAELLIAARGLQGIGAAISIPAVLGLLTSAFVEQAERSRALAAFASAGAVGFAAGLILGGLISDALGWRWVFGLTAPLVAVLFAMAWTMVPRDPAGAHRTGEVDLPGTLTATAGLLSLVYGLTNAGRAGWSAPATSVTLVCGIALLAGFLFLQTRTVTPLMPLRVWRRPQFGAVMAVTFCVYTAWSGTVFFLALSFQRVLNYGPSQAALAMLPLAVGGWLSATITGRLLPRTGPRPLLVAGLSMYTAGIALAALINADTSYAPHVVGSLFLITIGFSLAYVSCNVTALADAAPEERSLVGGLFTTCLQVASGLGLAVVSAVAAMQAEGTPVYRSALWTAALIAAASLALTLLFLRTRTPERTVGA